MSSDGEGRFASLYEKHHRKVAAYCRRRADSIRSTTRCSCHSERELHLACHDRRWPDTFSVCKV